MVMQIKIIVVVVKARPAAAIQKATIKTRQDDLFNSAQFYKTYENLRRAEELHS